jgi:hypothetical protein
MPTNEDDTYRRYLLGQLDEAERDALEARLFAGEDALTPDLQVAEDDLIDDYVCDRLPLEERRQFEASLPGSPSRRQKVALATDLARAARRPIGRQAVRGWGLAALAASLLIAAWGAWWLIGRGPAGRGPQDGTQVAGQSATSTSTPPDGATTVRVVLLAGVVRGASESPSVRLQPGTQVVELQAFVDIEGAVPARCHARIARVSGAEVWTGDVPLTRGRDGIRARLSVPASALSADDYLVTLATGPGSSGELANYAVRVVR